ncbi:MAG: tetratricopeptide repeat protein [Gammaproteobacteria bacterium]
MLLGKAQFAKFSLLDAEDSFQKAEKQGCKDPQIFLYLVRMRLYRGQLAQVDALYKNPKFLHARQLPESHLLRGDFYFSKGDYKNASAAYAQYYAASHDKAENCLSQVKLNLLNKHYQEAIGKSESCDMEFANKGNFNISESRYLRALSLLNLKNTGKAIETLESAVKQPVSDNPHARIQSALLLMRLYLAKREVNDAAKMADFVLRYIAVPDVYYAKGLMYEQENRYDLAEKQFLDALKLNPEHRPSLLELANIKYKEGNIEQARYYTGKVDAIDGKNLFTNRLDELQALKYFQAGDNDAVIDKLSHDKNIKSQYILALAYARKGEQNAALNAFAYVSKQLKDKTKSDLLEARLYVVLKEYAKAKSIYNPYVNKGNVYAVIGLAQLYIAEHEYGKAEGLLTQYHKQGRENRSINILIVELYSATNQKQKLFDFLGSVIKSMPGDTGYQLLRAGMYYKYAMLPEAIKQCDDIIETHPEKQKAYVIKANAYARQGDLDGAENTYEALLKQDPRNDYAYLMLSLLADKQSRYADALKYVDKSLNINPRNINAIHVKISTLIKQNQNDDAIAFAKSSAQLLGQENAEDLLLGFAYDKAGNIRKAYQSYSAALNNGLKDVRIAVKVYLLAKKLKGEMAASKQLDGYMRNLHTPRDIYFISNYMIKDYSLAEKYYELFIKQNKTNPVAYNNLAWLKLHAGDATAAQMYAEQALKLSPGSPAIMDTLGQILLKQGKYAQAGPYLLDAHKKLKDNPTIIYHLAQYYYHVNKLADARALLRQVVDTSFPEQEQAKQLLARLNQ